MQRKGFTLIEIVIVLAIAAFILIVLFYAVTSAQRSQRDNQRQNMAQRFSSRIDEFASTHNGNPPNTLADISNIFPPEDRKLANITYDVGCWSDSAVPGCNGPAPLPNDCTALTDTQQKNDLDVRGCFVREP